MSLVIALISLGVYVSLVLFGRQDETFLWLRFVAGSVSLAGFGYIIVILLLSGYRINFPLRRRMEQEKTSVTWNKIDAPAQDRRDTVILLCGVVLVLLAITGLYLITF